MQASRFVIPLLVTASAFAQSVIVPSSAATGRPTSSTFYVSSVLYSTSSTTTPHDSHAQIIYDVMDVGMPAGLWNSVQVRRPSSNANSTTLGNANPAMTTNATIMLSISPQTVANVTTTFATNHGPSPLTVFNGVLSLPAGPSQSAWPAPWQSPIPFSVPFVFAQASGKSLVVDLMQTGNSGTSAWYLEAQLPLGGARASNGASASTCKFSSGTYNNGIGYMLPTVGGSWYVNYSNLLANCTGFAWIGTQGVGGTYNGLTLPIDLGQFGAPGCFVQASADVIVPLTASGTSARWPTIPIPNNPALGNAVFYDHSLFIDPLANAWGVVVGWSSKWTIGTNIGAPAALVTATGTNAANPTGSLQNDTGVTLQFNP
jgi:hypothetical protein